MGERCHCQLGGVCDQRRRGELDFVQAPLHAQPLGDGPALRCGERGPQGAGVREDERVERQALQEQGLGGVLGPRQGRAGPHGEGGLAMPVRPGFPAAGAEFGRRGGHGRRGHVDPPARSAGPDRLGHLRALFEEERGEGGGGLQPLVRDRGPRLEAGEGQVFRLPEQHLADERKRAPLQPAPHQQPEQLLGLGLGHGRRGEEGRGAAQGRRQ
mmetsp:Transcript_1805/g.5091  ORF Transcript_1805/g.5091 Transcript_1805/m.5091 type:complete len:213 (-) Transcript_1805:561-1199(-)